MTSRDVSDWIAHNSWSRNVCLNLV